MLDFQWSPWGCCRAAWRSHGTRSLASESTCNSRHTEDIQTWCRTDFQHIDHSDDLRYDHDTGIVLKKSLRLIEHRKINKKKLLSEHKPVLTSHCLLSLPITSQSHGWQPFGPKPKWYGAHWSHLESELFLTAEARVFHQKDWITYCLPVTPGLHLQTPVLTSQVESSDPRGSQPHGWAPTPELMLK